MFEINMTCISVKVTTDTNNHRDLPYNLNACIWVYLNLTEANELGKPDTIIML